ncbi:uncharacterized protein [Drosophila takahashii]|uniref:uncharacterized protein n=1 Tax=Drosophila takahashii TaxID=29030 RepID=UPI00389904F0
MRETLSLEFFGKLPKFTSALVKCSFFSASEAEYTRGRHTFKEPSRGTRYFECAPLPQKRWSVFMDKERSMRRFRQLVYVLCSGRSCSQNSKFVGRNQEKSEKQTSLIGIGPPRGGSTLGKVHFKII